MAKHCRRQSTVGRRLDDKCIKECAVVSARGVSARCDISAPWCRAAESSVGYRFGAQNFEIQIPLVCGTVRFSCRCLRGVNYLPVRVDCTQTEGFGQSSYCWLVCVTHAGRFLYKRRLWWRNVRGPLTLSIANLRCLLPTYLAVASRIPGRCRYWTTRVLISFPRTAQADTAGALCTWPRTYRILSGEIAMRPFHGTRFSLMDHIRVTPVTYLLV